MLRLAFRVLLSPLFLLAFAACGGGDAPKTEAAARKASPYPDILEFVKQVKANTQKYSLKKTTLTDNEVETVDLPNPNYERELILFLTADIQKPAWQGLYQINTQGGVVTYATTSAKPDLKVLAIHRDSAQRITRLDVVAEQDNYLFKSESSGSMFLVYEGNKPRLDSLSMEGQQKIIFGSPFVYTLFGKVQ
jgi:hypothetical protein